MFTPQVRGRSSVTSVEPPSHRRETCCDTLSYTQERSLSNATSAITPVAGETPWLDIYARTQVNSTWCEGPLAQTDLLIPLFDSTATASVVGLHRNGHFLCSSAEISPLVFFLIKPKMFCKAQHNLTFQFLITGNCS